MAYSEKYCTTSVREELQNLDAEGWRIWVLQGSMSAGKTVAALLQMIDWSIEFPGTIGTIVADSLTRLRKDAMRTFLDICRDTNLLKACTWNASELVLSFPNGSIIEFCSIEQLDGQGAKRDFLYVNEANRISWKQFSDLEPRTRRRIIIDFNPVNKFWAHTELVENKYRTDVVFRKFTYLDNEGMDDMSVRALEMRRGDGTSNWWRVYGLGEIGSLEGNVYEGWVAEDELPSDLKLLRYGIDFGFSNDPTAVVAIYENDCGEIWLKQELCETKLLTPQLVVRLKEIIESDGDALVVCDNARPEIIAELQANGIRAIGCDKTPGEKMNGKRYNIELVQRRKIHYLRCDKELEQEYLTYAWRKKKSTGEVLDEPEDGHDHCMDAIAYAIRDLERKMVVYAIPRV